MLTVARAASQGKARAPLAFSPRLRSPISRKYVRTADGRRIAYTDSEGAGPCVLLIHGTLTTLEDMWLPLVDDMTNGGFRVIAADRPGYGKSVRARFFDASPWRQAAILHEAISTLGAGRPVVVGHSAGGAVALAYGMQFPDSVAGVVALAPICFPEVRLEHLLFGPRATPFAGPLLTAGLRMTYDLTLLPTLWQAMFLPQMMPPVFEEMFPFTLAGRPSQLVAEAEDSVALGPGLLRSALSYPSCRAPVEILGGDADVVVANSNHGRRAAGMIPGASYRALPGLGHMLHHFRPEEVVYAAKRVLELKSQSVRDPKAPSEQIV
jgi:pimeloyl-ACP methyl ester carboxylesterase